MNLLSASLIQYQNISGLQNNRTIWFELRKLMNMDSTNKLSEWEIKKNVSCCLYIDRAPHPSRNFSKNKVPTLLLHHFSINPVNRSSCDHTIGACDAPHFLTGTARTAGDFACELTQDEKQPLFDWWGFFLSVWETLDMIWYDDMYVPEKWKTTAYQTCKTPLTAWMESSFSAEHSSFFYGSSGWILWPCGLPGQSLCKPLPTCSFLAGTWFLRDCGGGLWFQMTLGFVRISGTSQHIHTLRN